MKLHALILLLALALVTSNASAERNLVPSLDSPPDICADRPSEPDWMQTIGLREAYRRVLVQGIYRAQNLTRIVEAGECSCQTRFPDWDAAEAEFLERYASAERWEMLEASDVYGREANALRPQAMAICEAAGNW